MRSATEFGFQELIVSHGQRHMPGHLSHSLFCSTIPETWQTMHGFAPPLPCDNRPLSGHARPARATTWQTISLPKKTYEVRRHFSRRSGLPADRPRNTHCVCRAPVAVLFQPLTSCSLQQRRLNGQLRPNEYSRVLSTDSILHPCCN